jgi:hypothetical protein
MRGSLLNPDESDDSAEATTNPWWSWFKGRSKGWWVGVCVTLVLTAVLVVLIEDRYNVQIRMYGPLLLLLGGAAGDWIASRIKSVREDSAYDEDRRARLWRRLFLVAGILLFVVNILPEYRENILTSGGGYYWSTKNSLLAGLGAILTLLAFATKPKNDAF